MIGFQFGFKKYRYRSLCRKGSESDIIKKTHLILYRNRWAHYPATEESHHSKLCYTVFRMWNWIDIKYSDLDWWMNRVVFFWQDSRKIWPSIK